MALEAFSLAITPLPGVTVPAGPDPQPWEQADGTFAVDWIQPHLDQITPEQKSAVDAALAAPPNTPIIPDSSAREPSFMLADASDYTSDASILADARTKETTLAGPSGAKLKFDYSLIINPTQLAAGEALAYTNPGFEKFADNTTKPYCEIHVNPLLISLSQAHPEFVQASLAHEMWHCIQNRPLRRRQAHSAELDRLGSGRVGRGDSLCTDRDRRVVVAGIPADAPDISLLPNLRRRRLLPAPRGGRHQPGSGPAADAHGREQRRGVAGHGS